jgi:hypothetical protein
MVKYGPSEKRVLCTRVSGAAVDTADGAGSAKAVPHHCHRALAVVTVCTGGIGHGAMQYSVRNKSYKTYTAGCVSATHGPILL